MKKHSSVGCLQDLKGEFYGYFLLIVEGGSVVARLIGHGYKIVTRHPELGKADGDSVDIVEEAVQGENLFFESL